MPSKSAPSLRSLTPPVATGSSGRGYTWLFFGLLLVLLAVFLYAFFKAKKEGFENATGNLMYFYIPECPYCKQLAPELDKLQTMIDEKRAPIKLNRINGEDAANKEVLEQYKISAYPALILEYGDKATPYSGERTADAVFKWATGITGSA